LKPLSLVLPCYNEEKSLRELAARALSCARKRNLTSEQFQLVLVENGSRDQSAQVMEAMTREPGGEFLKIVRVSPNLGYGNGLMQGLKAARPGFIAWSHADEQTDPEDAFRGWELLQKADRPTLVKGKRHGRALKEWMFSRVFEALLFLICGRLIREINAQPKVFDSGLLEHLTDPPLDFAFDLYVLLKAKKVGYQIAEIDVEFPPRKHGQSNWTATFRSRMGTILRMISFMFEFRGGKVS